MRHNRRPLFIAVLSDTACILVLQLFKPLHFDVKWYATDFGPLQIYTVLSGAVEKDVTNINITDSKYFICFMLLIFPIYY